jgi:two-component system, sensor histidine kinase and response regulator
MTRNAHGPVLIVEDETEIRDSLRDLLMDEGYSVEVAADGREALARLAEQRPCLVILDLILPVLSGTEVYDCMQADPALAEIPVVISTSDPARAPSGVTLMKKPINLPRLLQLVEKFC